MRKEGVKSNNKFVGKCGKEYTKSDGKCVRKFRKEDAKSVRKCGEEDAKSNSRFVGRRKKEHQEVQERVRQM